MNAKTLLLVLATLGSGPSAPAVERWGVFEIILPGPASGNPYLDVQFTATFSQSDAAPGGAPSTLGRGRITAPGFYKGEKSQADRRITAPGFDNGEKNQRVTVRGFYDGDGVYKVRFSPPTQGSWQYETRSNRPELDGKSGSFTVGPPSAQQSRAGPGLPDVLPALRRRLALSPVRHHLLRLGASAARAPGADAQDARRLAVQQDPLLRLPQELLHRQQERAGALRLPEEWPTASSTSAGRTPSSGGTSSGASSISRSWASRPTSSSGTPTTAGASRR